MTSIGLHSYYFLLLSHALKHISHVVEHTSHALGYKILSIEKTFIQRDRGY